MSTYLFIAGSVWTIASTNDAAIAEHKAKAPAAAALIAQAPALLREADQVIAQARAAGHSIPAQPAYGRKIRAIVTQANKDFGLGMHYRPLAVCAEVTANLEAYYGALFDEDQRFAAQWRRDYAKSLQACRTAIRTPPKPEITITGPKNALPPKTCGEIWMFDGSAATQSTWVCPAGTKL